MRIGGSQKLTLLDYPGKVACTVFLSGCDLRCPYCHNPGLVLPEQSEGSEIPEGEVLSFLERRKGKLDGVCDRCGQRKCYGQHTAAVIAFLHPNATAVEPCDLPHQRKTEPRSAKLAAE